MQQIIQYHILTHYIIHTLAIIQAVVVYYQQQVLKYQAIQQTFTFLMMMVKVILEDTILLVQLETMLIILQVQLIIALVLYLSTQLILQV